MFNVEKLLGQMLSGGMGGGRKRSRSGGFGIPGVSNATLGVGAIGLAIAAWEHFKSAPSAAQGATGPAPQMPPPPPRPMAPPAPPPTLAAASPMPAEIVVEDPARVADAAHLIRSMIAAANADAVIDAEERAGILERALEAGLDSATQQFLMGELRAPASLDQIAAATRPELRMETFAAALIAVNIDSDAERVYIERLAAALGLGAEDQRQVRQQLGMA